MPAQLKASAKASSGADMGGTDVHKDSSLPAQFKPEAISF
jgi:hypothetical protein